VSPKEKFSKTWKEFTHSPRAKQVQKYIRRFVILIIVGIIIYQLFEIGWAEVLRNLPVHPLFYILFFILYLTLPIGEVFIYRQVWPIKKRKLFNAFLTKRVYNEEVIGYSGEFYLFMWARKYLDKRDWEILKNVRDNNIISALSSNLVAFTLVGTLVFTGVINIEEIVGNIDLLYVVTAIVIAAALVALIIQFRKYIFELPVRKAIIVFIIYLTRFLLHHGLLIIQWAVVIPDTPLSVWFLFVAIIIMVNRIPFLPSRDLIFMWAGIELSRMLDMATAAVAGMLLVSSALKKSTNLILFLLFSYFSTDSDLKPVKEKTDIEPGDKKYDSDIAVANQDE
jgi:hypothetical protein